MSPEMLVALPVLVLLGGALVVILLHAIAPADERATVWLGALIALAAAVAAFAGPADATTAGIVSHDERAVLFSALVCFAAALSTLAGMPHTLASRVPAAHLTALLLVSTSGAVIAVAAQDLVAVFVGLELLWLPLYTTTRIVDPDARAHDAALATLLLGASGAATLAYGTALLYAGTGSTAIGAVAAAGTPVALAGIALILVGVGQSAALGPFSTWAAAVRATTASGVGAFASTVPALASFAVLLRLAGPITTTTAFPLDWRATIAGLAAVTIVLPALAALAERSVRRVVAYATTAQLGYAALGIAAGPDASAAVATALAVAVLTNVGAFAALAALGSEVTIDGLRGLARRRPLTAAATFLVLLAAAGVPPTAGFVARAYVFEAAASAQLAWLVVLGALAGVLWAIVAVRVLAACLRDGVGEWSDADPVSSAVLMLCALAVAAAGIAPGRLLDAMR